MYIPTVGSSPVAELVDSMTDLVLDDDDLSDAVRTPYRLSLLRNAYTMVGFIRTPILPVLSTTSPLPRPTRTTRT